jgi:SAM-dependent methyltransferase
MSRADRDKWDARYAKETPGERVAPAWLAELDAELPREGRALDVAAGSGRLALWAARRGLEAVAVDVSPVGLSLARRAAEAEGLPVSTVERDLAADPRLPDGPFALVTCLHYEQPDLWPALRAALGPAGVLVAEIATVRNLERHAHPSRRYLVAPNELLARRGELELVYYREGWLDGRHVARLLARR